jgi:hypothetical protein
MEGWGGLWENWGKLGILGILGVLGGLGNPNDSEGIQSMTKHNRGLPLRASPQGGFALAPTHGYSDKGFLRNRWDFLIIPIFLIIPKFPIFPIFP